MASDANRRSVVCLLRGRDTFWGGETYLDMPRHTRGRHTQSYSHGGSAQRCGRSLTLTWRLVLIIIHVFLISKRTSAFPLVVLPARTGRQKPKNSLYRRVRLLQSRRASDRHLSHMPTAAEIGKQHVQRPSTGQRLRFLITRARLEPPNNNERL